MLFRVDASSKVAGKAYRDQPIAFFWEYYLTHLEGVKTYSAGEQTLAARLRGKDAALDARFNFYARDHVGSYLRAQGVPLVDPVEAFRTESGTLFSDHIHYTREGNQLIASVLYRELRELLHRRRH